MSDTKKLTPAEKRHITIERRYGPDFYARAGKQGGQANVAKNGKGHMSTIGRTGGQVVKQNRGIRHYQDLGRKSAEARGL